MTQDQPTITHITHVATCYRHQTVRDANLTLRTELRGPNRSGGSFQPAEDANAKRRRVCNEHGRGNGGGNGDIDSDAGGDTFDGDLDGDGGGCGDGGFGLHSQPGASQQHGEPATQHNPDLFRPSITMGGRLPVPVPHLVTIRAQYQAPLQGHSA